jgi:hypothetical protein
MKLASRSLLLATLASLAKQLENKQHNFTLYCTHSHARCEKAPRQRLVMNKMQQQTDRHLCLSPPRSEVPPMLGAPKFLETALRTARQPCGVLRELNCRRSFPAAPAGVLRKLKSPVGVARRQSGSATPGVQSLSAPYLLLRTAAEASVGVPQLRRVELGDSPAEKGIALPELTCRRVSPAGAARPLVHQILTML